MRRLLSKPSLPFACLLLALGFTTPASAGMIGPMVDLVPVASGLSSPATTTHPPNDDRLFIAQLNGVIRIFDLGSDTLLPTPFLDISSQVSSGGERGLLGLAFHPEYAVNGTFYVYYSVPDTTGNVDHFSVVSRFWVSAGDPDIADPGSELELMRIPQPFSNHNGGMIAFGADDLLYIALGDGGSGNDPLDSGQDLGSLLGSILRIDPYAGNCSTGLPYCIPPDNPFVGQPGVREEIWAWGLRNPYRFSFDRRTGDMWIGDVGQNAWEEVNLQPVSSAGGENYGWRCREGFHDFLFSGDCASQTFTEPVLEYSHSDGRCSITGGYRYRGSDNPNLGGLYIFGDYCTGEIWGARAPQPGEPTWPFEPLFNMADFALGSFGEDWQGELYVASLNGTLYRLHDSAPEIGVFSDGFEDGNLGAWSADAP